ncbi:aminotransferase class V-fold PLP-dependent enzyme [Roseivirga pacifica]|uniref:aminotransferase class V-fold PLP-dependent enzyme n=1 Tax=Roseivirga pacifica TaxID=1267423 RepID=UPI003BAFF1D9
MTNHFPIFSKQTPLGQPLIYLDSAASTQKPQVVIDAITDFYTNEYASTGRGSYWPANAASAKYEHVRHQVASFLNAKSDREIVFTSGTTDAINKVARSFVYPRLSPGDRVVITTMEHHSNYLPWQQICREKKCELVVAPLNQNGTLNTSALEAELAKGAKFLSLTAVSNVLGTQNDVTALVSLAHQYDVPVLVDAAQAVAHNTIDVQGWDCDFLVFSGHKCYGPTGVGVLYGKTDYLSEMQPADYGGGMVQKVNATDSSFRPIPHKHEAGTPNVAGVIGLGAALGFLQKQGLENVYEHEQALTVYALNQLAAMDSVTIYGSAEERGPVISFNLDGVHPHDLSTFLNEQGICIRAGHHCAQPLMQWLDVAATARVSFGMYNTKADIDQLVAGLKSAYQFFR